MTQKVLTALSCCLALILGCAGTEQIIKRETPDLAKSISIAGTAGKTYRAFWPDKSLMAEGPVVGNKKNGPWKLFYQGTGGKTLMAEVTFRDDLLDGPMKEYYSSGKKMVESEYKNGILHGRYMSFYESGIGKIEAFFKEGKRSGISPILASPL